LKKFDNKWFIVPTSEEDADGEADDEMEIEDEEVKKH
jgi:hypothetical protein